MRILVTGATGLVGRRLVVDRLHRGDHVVILSRDAGRASRIFAAEANPNVSVVEGNPAHPGTWQQVIDGIDAVIHLAGASVADKRWSEAYKRQLVTTRVDSTYQVVQAIERAASRPRVLISASAVGYYGDTGGHPVDETAGPGSDFLARLSIEWEVQAMLAEAFDVRVVCLRFGVVLDREGGALARLARFFHWFVGGPFGSGRQDVPWIHWADVVGLVDLCLRHDEASGPINAVAPNPVPARRFCRAIGQAMGRPSWLPAPTPLLRLALGEFGRYLGASQNVRPAKAIALGYGFRYREVEPAMVALLGSDEDQDAIPAITEVSDAAEPTGRRPISDGVQPVTRPRLIAIDVDGTLLRSDGNLSRSVIDACRAAERAGSVIVLATARPPRGMTSIVQALGVVAPTINYSGAVIWNPIDDDLLYHEALDGQTAWEMITAARDAVPGLFVGIESLNAWYTDNFDRRFESTVGRMVEPDEIAPIEVFLELPVTRLNFLAEPDEIDAAAAVLAEEFWQHRRVAMVRAGPRHLQFIHPLADKSVALQRIASRMEVDQGSVMAIGDADNDLGMLEWAGFSVAMHNASPAVRELADVVAPGNDENGVARSLWRYVIDYME